MRSLTTYKNILKQKGLRYSVAEVWRLIDRFHYIKDQGLLEQVWLHKISKRLKKRYAHFEHSYSSQITIPNPYPDKIWVCWLQGEKNAPLLVKKCIASIRKYAADKEVIIITNDNLSQYITFPDFILKNKIKGRITNTHFSDIIRIYLLAKYGGIWIDATVYLTGPLPAYALNTPLFCYKTSLSETEPIKMSSWFISAQPNHEIIVRTQQLITEYWKHNTWLCHYYLFHLLFSIAIDSKTHLKEQWKAIPYFNSCIPHTLSTEITNSYQIERWEQIKQISSIHKLTYKLSPEIYEQKNTFLQLLLNN